MATSSERLVEALRSSLKENERLRQQNQRFKDLDEEPIAIVSMACRYPGEVNSPEDLWRLVETGTDAISAFPTDRGWDPDRLYDPDPDHRGTSYTRHGGFLHTAANFDPAFFGISPREALAIDPQQRLLLEVAWETIERAGVDPTSLHGTSTGVFTGVMYGDYGSRLLNTKAPEGFEGYLGTGSSYSIVSGRLSYTLGLEGPAVTIDTACSSSLVAIHLACHALRRGECTMALAGGVTVMATPATFIEFSRQRGLSPDGRCKSFSATADGTGWSEGAGLLLLERLSDAQRHGHPVLALIRGSAVNQDGASNGLTAPNGPSQQRVIQTALANAGLTPDQVDVVEAHGTGTTLGDPIEALALQATYGQHHTTDRPLWLGAIKSNIGHTQAAAGVAGIIKIVQALRHELLPRTLHAEHPTPHLDWDTSGLRLLTEPVPWVENGRPRRAGVSSFGISGTNAHLIIEQPPEPDPAPEPEPENTGPTAWLISAKTAPALRAQAQQLLSYLDTHPHTPISQVAAQLHTRAHFEHRAVVIGDTPPSIRDGLQALTRDQTTNNLTVAVTRDPGKTVFVFPGQGCQYPGMGRELYDTYPVFAEALDQVCAEFNPHLEHPLRDIIFASPEDPLIHQTGYTQPALFAFQVALYRLLTSHGLAPDFLIGHSIGELSAAYLAGVWSLPDAVSLVTRRATLMQTIPTPGAMTSVTATPDQVREVITTLNLTDQVHIAAINSPTSTVITGDPDPVNQVTTHLTNQGHRTQPLTVSHAFHSHHLDPVLDQLTTHAATLTTHPPTIPVISNLTGQPATPDLYTDPGYWAQQARHTVTFAAGINHLNQQHATTYIELSPHPTLTTHIHTATSTSEPLIIPTLRRDHHDPTQLLTTLAQAHTHGLPVTWPDAGTGGGLDDLPTYPFQRQRYWLQPAAGSDVASVGLRAAGHPLLGAAVHLADGDGLVLTGRLSLATQPWLADHVVAGTILLPGTGLADLALYAASLTDTPHLTELTLQTPLIIPEHTALQLQVTTTGNHLSIHSRPDTPEDAEWVCHATGTLTHQPPPPPPAPPTQWPPAGATPIDLTHAYPTLAAHGYQYGPTFQALHAAWHHDTDLYTEVHLPQEGGQGHLIHPALLDAALHPLTGELGVPSTWSGLHLHATAATTLRVRLTRTAPDQITLNATDTTNQPVITATTLTLRPITPEQLTTPTSTLPLYQPTWTPHPGTPEATAAETYTILAPSTDTAPWADTAVTDPADLAADPPLTLLIPITATEDGEEDVVQQVHRVCEYTLTLLQQCLTAPHLADTRLVFLTHHAVATHPDEDIHDLPAAAALGLLRSAQTENPDRITLIDLDTNTIPEHLSHAITTATRDNEPHLAIRGAQLFTSRLVPTPHTDHQPPAWNPDGTVLVTGGTGVLASLTARHLITHHHVRHLILASRTGPDHPDAPTLHTELTALGAQVTITACDTTNREQLQHLLDSIPDEHPLTAVIHTAGVLHDTVLPSLTPQTLHQVLDPKVDTAWHLHQLTAGMNLAAFISYSSIAGTLGTAGQANYAAANAFLDALAHHRHTHHQPATTLAWGLWAQASAMTRHLEDSDQSRLNRQGVRPLTTENALALLDTALTSTHPVLAAVHLDLPTLRTRAHNNTLPTILTNLITTTRRAINSTNEQSSLAQRLAGLNQTARYETLLDLIRTHLATVLGRPDPTAINPTQPFKDLGIDSLTAVELRNQLTKTTGLRLPTTLVFDYPNPHTLATYLDTHTTPTTVATTTTATAGPVDEPIAIVSMGCRYPGQVNSPEDLWHLLDTGTDAITTFPTDRGWNLDRLYHPDPDHRGTAYTRHGGFLHNATTFDPTFFGISPREATAMDPQQRVLLEIAWETIERAGIDPTTLHGTTCGIYTGVISQEYAPSLQTKIPEDYEGYFATGATTSVASGRLAYTLGLEGPAVTIDTACSSSLVAIHLACHALRHNECTMALAGGATIMPSPRVFIEFSRQRGLSADGRCKSFSADADGTGWGEGAGLLLLERLSDAQRHGHPVLALIRGSAVNQDGASNGLTAPNGPSQQRVIQTALANAGLTPDQVDVVEAHGTGTTLGDPIEALALQATYGQHHTTDRPLWLGAIKSNIGHTQAAAGVAGIIKIVQALRHELLPRTLHAEHPTPHLDWDTSGLRLLTEPVPWVENGRPRRAGVSSFGISGTNAHLIIEQPPEPDPAPEPEPKSPGPTAWLISAKTAPALRAQAQQLLSYLDTHPHTPISQVAAQLHTRAHFEHRAVVTGDTPPSIRDGLQALARGQTTSNLTTATTRQPGRTVFVFPGQGCQYPGMGRELYDTYPVFAEALDQICAEFNPHLEHPLRDIIFASPEDRLIHQTGYTQPALFAFHIALYQLLTSHGLTPDYLIGHSIGELSAAYLAGVWSLPDAVSLVARRATLMQTIPTPGAMTSVTATPDQVREAITTLNLTDQVHIAAINSPTSTVITGDPDPVAQVTTHLTNQGHRTQPLTVSHAFHSHHLDPVLDELTTHAAALTTHPPTIPVISNLTGRPATAELYADPNYWARQVRHTVAFAAGINHLNNHQATTYLELGPHPTLTTHIHTTTSTSTSTSSTEPLIIPTLRRDHHDPTQFLTALAQAHTHGLPTTWPTTPATSNGSDLPTYPFQRQRYWLQPAAGSDVASVGLRAAGHPLLGAAVHLADGDGLVLTGRLSLATQPWLADHAVAGTILLPGTGLADLALYAASLTDTPHLTELALQTPLIIPEHTALQLQVTTTTTHLTIHSRPDTPEDAEWVCHATGTLTHQPPPAPPAPPAQWPPAGATPIDLTHAYRTLAAHGYQYGPTFQALHAAWHHDTDLYTEVHLPQEGGQGHLIHPALLDAALHPLTDELGVPSTWSGLHLHATAATTLRVRLTRTAPDQITLNATDTTNQPVITATTLTLRPITPDQLTTPTSTLPLYQPVWTPHPATPEATAAETYTQLDPNLTNLADLAADPPPVLLIPITTQHGDDDDVPAQVHRVCEHTLTLLQQCLTTPHLADTRLVFLTHHAVATHPDEDIHDLPAAAALGLLRTAQTENPDRITLIDLDEPASPTTLATALATNEPHLAIRNNQLLTPRLVPTTHTDHQPPAWNPDGTVLVTGGTGVLASLTVRHLVTHHHVRHLILASRTGPDHPDAPTLHTELTALGAQVTITTCDTTNRHELQHLLESIPDEHPLTAVIHTAGILHDTVLPSLTPQSLHSVLDPKVDTAWHLHQLTAGMNLAAFISYSSIAGTLGTAGQANYAAANAFLDALAHHRHTHHQPATTLTWGPWTIGMAADLQPTNQTRLHRQGVHPLTTENALALLDTALTSTHPVLAPIHLDLPTLRTRAHNNTLPTILTNLITTTRRATNTTTDRNPLAQRLTELDETDRHQAVLDLVRTHLATVLAHPDPTTINPTQPFKDLGIDSLTAVELRNQLTKTTGLRLPTTLVFDYPTPTAVAHEILHRVLGTEHQPTTITPTHDTTDEPIAIVSIGCRYPGNVTTPEDLWHLLDTGTDAITTFPTDRGWNLDQLYHPDPDHRGTSYTRHGGFLHNAATFDPAFFGISPREALATDPQQRVLLEIAWEAVERAGIDPTTVHGQPWGIYTGMAYTGYGYDPRRTAQDLEGYLLTGTTTSVASGRLSYTLGLEGPAVTIDTACSSSLVAIHLACHALRHNECTMALAGGATIMATPDMFIEFSRQRGLSPDGRCKSFSANADGTGWSEGAGLLLLERLSDAQHHGHPILALIRGSAVNQDGASNGLTAPNGPSQQRVIHTALTNAGLTPDQIDAVEAHGTGTTLGDPIEAQALQATYGQHHTTERPLWLGSIKSNIGHPIAAAGVAGIIKMVLALNHHQLPRTLHADNPTPHLDWDTSGLRLLTEPTPWVENGHPRRAGISSFGVSGTNAHVIIEQPPQTQTAPAPESPGPTAWLISAKTAPALRAQAQQLLSYLDTHPHTPISQVAAQLHTRTHFEHRAVVTGDTPQSIRDGLQALARDQTTSNLTTATTRQPGRTVFVFPGQGCQYPGMGRGLYQTYPVFAEAFDEVCAEFDQYLERPLRDVVFAPPGDPLIHQTGYTQPALFAFHIALYQLLTSHGLTPDYLIGHSIGELSAAYLAGVWSLPEAVSLVARRATLMQTIPTPGAMTSVTATPDQVREAITTLNLTDQVHIAAINSPTSTVITGDPDPVNQVTTHLTNQGHRTQPLTVSHAFHSHHLDPVLDQLTTHAATLTTHPPTIPVISNLTGQPATAELYADPNYWARQVRHTVAFAAGINHLNNHQATTYLELSPHPTLTTHIHTTTSTSTSTSSTEPLIIPTLRRDHHDPTQFLTALAQAHTHGLATTWPTSPATSNGSDLPTYPFQRQHYWLRPSPVDEVAQFRPGQIDHPLLGRRVDLAGTPGQWFSHTLTAGQPWFIGQNRLAGTPALPPSAMLDWALAAALAATRSTDPRWTLERVEFDELLAVPEGKAVAVQTTVQAEDGGYRVRCFGQPVRSGTGDWKAHLVATAVPGVSPRPDPVDPQALRAPLDPMGTDQLYERLWLGGADPGPEVRAVDQLWRSNHRALALISAGAAVEDRDAYLLHPVVLESCLHVAGLLTDAGEDAVLVPRSIDRVGVYERLPTRVWCHARRTGDPDGAADPDTFDLDLLSEAGTRLATVEGLRLRRVPRVELAALSGPRLAGYELTWQPFAATAAEVGNRPGTWLIVGTDPGQVGQWQAQLAGADLSAVAVVAGRQSSPARPGVRWVDPGDDGDLRRLFTELRTDAAGIAGIVLHTDTRDTDGRDANGRGADGRNTDGRDGVPEDASRLARDAYAVLDAFLQTCAEDRPEVVVLTVGATVTGQADPPPDLVQSGLTGAARAVVAGYPGIRCVQADLDPEALAPSLPEVLARAAALPGPGHLAVRGDRWYEARLRERELPAAPDGAQSLPVRPDATYLVACGPDGAGMAIAAWLADRGARWLLLVDVGAGGSTSVEGSEAVAALRDGGVRVRVLASPGHPTLPVEILDGTGGELPAVRGVVQAVGTGAGEDPRLRLAWALHLATAGLSLDFFVVFSSAASLFGRSETPGGAAGDTFLESLAAYRRRLGSPCLSVGTGPWTADAASGWLDVVPIGELMAAVGGLAGCAPGGPESVGLVSVRWPRLFAGPEPAPYTALADLPPTGRAGSSKAERMRELLRLVSEDPAAARQALVVDLLDRLAPLLGMSTADRDRLLPVFGTMRLNEVGLTSLTTVALRDQLLADFSADVPPDVLFGGTTSDVVSLIYERLALRSILVSSDDDDAVNDEETEILTL